MECKHNYNIFTKSEFIEFINQYEDMFRMIDNPFDIMIDKKMDFVMDKIEELNKNSKMLTEKFETDKDKLSYFEKIGKNHEEWKRLNKEYNKLSKLRFGY